MKKNCPTKIPLTDGMYGNDFDVIEEELPNDWITRQRRLSWDMYGGITRKEAQARPMAVNRGDFERLPGAKLITVDEE
jgi:hypothetical protein